jgi:DNA-binding response OmpR family regulator
MKVLVIDDSTDITEVVRVYCESTDLECDVTTDGRGGLAAIRENKYDLVLLDVAMPEFSGLDVIRTLKKDGILEKTNVVVFTASSDSRIYQEVRNSGVKEILKKPCGLKELEEVIKKYS